MILPPHSHLKSCTLIYTLVGLALHIFSLFHIKSGISAKCVLGFLVALYAVHLEGVRTKHFSSLSSSQPFVVFFPEVSLTIFNPHSSTRAFVFLRGQNKFFAIPRGLQKLTYSQGKLLQL